MTIGIIGQKRGMTRVFREDGYAVPVTVIEATPNRVSQIKTLENDGYNSVQVTAGEKKSSRVNKPLTGHFAKSKVTAGQLMKEFRLADSSEHTIEAGAEINVSVFENIGLVDVTGVSLGKGFAGTIKRHNFTMQPATHGNSLSHRVGGSTGQNQTPSKVFKGKKMAGQMGNKQCTVQNLEIVRIDVERNLILVKGSVPGHDNSFVIVKPAVKKNGEGS